LEGLGVERGGSALVLLHSLNETAMREESLIVASGA